jgi:hypothetical protein
MPEEGLRIPGLITEGFGSGLPVTMRKVRRERGRTDGDVPAACSSGRTSGTAEPYAR